ncbi:MAG TPA: DUF3108 domain-containing protein [Burkholderiales bacterium]|nr:DUF3108 domain-containing protein [Burkholderiales bacterium]
MRRSDRVLLLAVGASAGLHLMALVGIPRFDLGARIDDSPPPPPLEARLLPPPPPAPAAAPPNRAPDARRPTRRAPPLLPLVQEAVVPQYEYPEGPFEGIASAASDAPSDSAGAPAGEAYAVAEAAPAPAEYPLRHAKLVFDLYYGAQPSKVGQVTHTWAQDGHEYRVETVAEAVGFVSLLFNGRLVQHSSGVFTADGLLPTVYRAELGSRSRTEVARFDWAEGKIALTSKGESRLVDLPAGAQDPLSMLHQLYFMKPIPEAAQLDVATGRKLYRYLYRIVGETQIETPLGLVRALQMRRQDPDGARMDVWLDLDRSLLPARIHSVDRRGMVLEQVIREARLELADAAQ